MICFKMGIFSKKGLDEICLVMMYCKSESFVSVIIL